MCYFPKIKKNLSQECEPISFKDTVCITLFHKALVQVITTVYPSVL